MQIPFWCWLFQGIPECIVMAALVSSLSLGEIPWRKVIPTGLVVAVATYLIRLMPFTPGVHVIINICVLGFASVGIGKIKLRKAFIYSAICMALLVITELLVRLLIISSGLFTLEEIHFSIFLRIVTGYPQDIILLIIALVIKKKNPNFNRFFRNKQYFE